MLLDVPINASLSLDVDAAPYARSTYTMLLCKRPRHRRALAPCRRSTISRRRRGMGGLAPPALPGPDAAAIPVRLVTEDPWRFMDRGADRGEPDKMRGERRREEERGGERRREEERVRERDSTRLAAFVRVQCDKSEAVRVCT